jgi:hypothetical protein
VVFVPDSDVQKVSDAVFAAGAGVIGQYNECSFRVAGTGTFFGTEATNPVVGQKGRREEVPEWRLEVVVPESLVGSVVAAMRRAHSYEEPAFDVYPLRPMVSGGAGRMGELEQPTTLSELAKRAQQTLSASTVQVVGDLSRPVRTVAVACGAARNAGIGLILPGHYATERPAVEELAVQLAAQFPGLQAWPSRVECDPLTRI